MIRAILAFLVVLLLLLVLHFEALVAHELEPQLIDWSQQSTTQASTQPVHANKYILLEQYTKQ
jgi:hypothetical protein